MLALGRSLFAVALMGFGVLCLIYRDFVHNLQPVDLHVPPTTPGYVPLALLSGGFLVVAGLATLLRHRTAPRLLMAVAIYLLIWIVVLQVPTAFLYPELLRSPWWVRTFEVLAMSGAAMMLTGALTTERSDPAEPRRDVVVGGDARAQRLMRVGRILFGISLPVFGVLHLIYGPGTARLIPSYYPVPLFLACFTGTAKIAAGLAIASGIFARLAAMLTALQYAIYVTTLHLPLQLIVRANDPQRPGMTSLFVAVAFCGAALVVAGTVPRADATARRKWFDASVQRRSA